LSAGRKFIAALLTALCLGLASGAGAADLLEGRDYRELTPPLAPEKNRIEVIEFFWYGCPHCFDFEPVLTSWIKKLPADVMFRRVPAVFPNDKWAPSARIYYTLEAMNLIDRLHGEVFHAMHVERKRLDDDKVLLQWLAGNGVDTRQFKETWSSFGVQTRVHQAREMTKAAALGGVPAVVVQGRYQAIIPGQL